MTLTMKKYLLLLAAATLSLALSAKVVTITLTNGEKRYFSTSQLGSIDMNEDGTVVNDYNGEPIDLGDDISNVTVNDDPVIYQVEDKTWEFSYDRVAVSELNLDIDLTSLPGMKRDVRILRYLYPSVDPSGEPITLSGIIVIPKNILDCCAPSDGILLVNHFTIANYREAPTEGYAFLEAMLLANPLAPNYIMVESDFYGFGTSVRFPQAYLFGQANAKASIDGLVAAKQLLDEMGIDYGKYLFNVGYSSGGFDALAVQKEVDNNHRGEIKIDKTFAGGSPSDLMAVYEDYVNTDAITYLVSVPLMLVSYKESANMEIDYNDVFQPWLAEHIDEWILSKEYSTQPINDKIGREKKVSDMLQPAFTNVNGPEAAPMVDLMKAFSLATDWNVDTEANIYLFHSRDDDYVTFQAARSLTDYLTDNGFEKSIIPGRTNLQTNLVVKKMGHLTATLVYLVQSVAALKAWPQIYATPESTAAFKALVSQELNAEQVLMALEQMGLDVRVLVNKLAEQGVPLTYEAFVGFLYQQLGVTPDEFVEMCDDSGLSAENIKQLFDYLNSLETVEPVDGEGNALQAVKRSSHNPIQQYENQFNQWLHNNGIVY